ncbi:hypothetical protein BDP27DRAFT_1417449 [Rhodocollybia butyracea]|uniref:Uncharacterized protein n=1 Tax=Rhodocollybia butyracea TaxID=206335 RepID=A0A9P5UBQ5_9AGAR|nr:hypothetical protein BDP27DRAFT_1417449 [Rhodocollybia butyracea]
MRKALLVVLWGAAEALSGPGDLHLTITPTVTMGQTFEASWTWFSYQLPTPHMFVVALEGESYKKNFSISQAGFSGVIPLTVPNTGTLQATLVRTNMQARLHNNGAVATFFAMNLVSMPSGPASPSPRTPLPPSATPPSGTMSLPLWRILVQCYRRPHRHKQLRK